MNWQLARNQTVLFVLLGFSVLSHFNKPGYEPPDLYYENQVPNNEVLKVVRSKVFSAKTEPKGRRSQFPGLAGFAVKYQTLAALGSGSEPGHRD